MKGAYWLWLALGLSALFNLFVIAGYMQAGAGVDDPSELAANVVTGELQLDEAQRSTYRALHDDFRKNAGTLTDNVTLLRESMLEELESENPDIDRVMELLDREAELHREWKKASGERFRTFVGVLSPDQRRRMSGRMRRGPHGPRHPPERLAKFDENGDGELDADERAAARAAIRERRRGQAEGPPHPSADRNGDGQVDPDEETESRDHREQRRSQQRAFMRLQLVAQFDANEDGTLDDEELEALRVWLEEPIEVGPPLGEGRPPGDRRPGRRGEGRPRPPHERGP